MKNLVLMLIGFLSLQAHALKPSLQTNLSVAAAIINSTASDLRRPGNKNLILTESKVQLLDAKLLSQQPMSLEIKYLDLISNQKSRVIIKDSMEIQALLTTAFDQICIGDENVLLKIEKTTRKVLEFSIDPNQCYKQY